MIPNHILIVGGPGSGKLRIAKLILGVSELKDVEEDSHSGIILKTELNTKYYQSNLNIMIDEFPADRLSTTNEKKLDQLKVWCDEFKAEECKELREVLDGFIFTLNLDEDPLIGIEQQLEIIYNLKSALYEEEEGFTDVFFLIVGVSKEKMDYLALEDIALQYGLEFVSLNESGTNEYKDKIGKDRIREVLENHEWKNTSNVINGSYEENKRSKLKSEMTQSLLAEDSPDESFLEEFDLTHIMGRLKIAKEQADEFETKEDKEKFAQNVINDLINYI